MLSQQDQIHILYKIALRIGEGEHLKQIAQNALSAYQKNLQAYAGAILRKNTKREECWYSSVLSIPENLDKLSSCTQVLELIHTSPLDCSKTKDLPQLPHIIQDDNKGLSYLMELPGFGLMILCVKEKPLPENLINALNPLNKKLADSLLAYMYKQRLHIQSEALEASHNAILISDSQGYIQWVNKAWCKLNGYSCEEVLGEYTNIIKSEQTDDAVFSKMWEKLDQGKVWTGNIINKRKDGSEYNADINITPVKNAHGKISNYISISQDVTAKYMAEEALRESKDRFEELSTLLPQPIWEIDIRGNIRYTNKAGYELFGYSAEDVKNGLHFLQIIAPRDRRRIQSIFVEKTISGRTVKDNEYTCINKEGKEFPVMIYSAPIIKKGKIIGIRGIVLDVTNLKNTEQRLVRFSSLQDLLIRISTRYINIPVKDRDDAINSSLSELGEFVDADRAYIFDYDFERQITNNKYEWCRSGISPQIDELQNVPLEAIPQWTKSHLRGEAIYVPKVEDLDPDDDLRKILEPQDIKSLIAVPMYNGLQCVGFMGFDSVRHYHTYSEKEKSLLEVFAQIVVNLNNRYQAEFDLQEAKTKAEKAEQAQFSFLSTMSHEIRTPLNAVVGLSNILLMDNPREDQAENLNTLKFSAQNLLHIINDILDYNKLLSGNINFESNHFKIHELISPLIYSMSNLAADKNIKLYHEIDEKVPEVLISDPTRLLQILNNLLSNAIKFTRSGKVELSVKVQDQIQDEYLLSFSVKDTGIGIPEDKHQAIFEEFKQSSSTITREFGGTGLGLPIVKKLLQVMGSDIQLSSEVGKGTEFSFQLKLKKGKAELVEKADEKSGFDDSLKGIRVLLVEDNKINQMVALRFLKEWYCNIEIANNGKEALALLNKQSFDIILMDLHMPVMDGYTAAQKIRSHESEHIRNTPIVALSASALGEIELKSEKYGLDGFVTKPFNPNELFAALIKQTLVRKEKRRKGLIK